MSFFVGNSPLARGARGVLTELIGYQFAIFKHLPLRAVIHPYPPRLGREAPSYKPSSPSLWRFYIDLDSQLIKEEYDNAKIKPPYSRRFLLGFIK